jgi:hypothetical protein
VDGNATKHELGYQVVASTKPDNPKTVAAQQNDASYKPPKARSLEKVGMEDS